MRGGFFAGWECAWVLATARKYKVPSIFRRAWVGVAEEERCGPLWLGPMRELKLHVPLGTRLELRYSPNTVGSDSVHKP